MRTHLEIGRNLLWSAGLAYLICSQIATPSVQADPIMKMIELDQVTNDWCRQHADTEVEIEKCVFNSQ